MSVTQPEDVFSLKLHFKIAIVRGSSRLLIHFWEARVGRLNLSASALVYQVLKAA